MQPNNMPPQYPQGQSYQPVPQGISPMSPQLPSDKSTVGITVGLIVSILLLVGALIFGLWAFTQMQDYKNNSDKKSAAAVVVANEAQKKELQAQFAEQEKSPLKSYTSPSAFGSVKLIYPKTWSTYVVEVPESSSPVDGYFYPNFVPNINGKNNYYLRVRVANTPYANTIATYAPRIKDGSVKVTSFAPTQVPGAAPGVKITGKIEGEKIGTMVILPIRDKTLKIWTESDSANADFETVLKNLTYSP